MKMTKQEWRDCIDFLVNAEIGQYAEYEGRMIEIVDMIAGDYMMFDENHEFCGVTNQTRKAAHFLSTGKFNG